MHGNVPISTAKRRLRITKRKTAVKNKVNGRNGRSNCSHLPLSLPPRSMANEHDVAEASRTRNARPAAADEALCHSKLIAATPSVSHTSLKIEFAQATHEHQHNRIIIGGVCMRNKAADEAGINSNRQKVFLFGENVQQHEGLI
ncbi:hypothetical protein RB195_004085 [Necator americanus]|uniref:Uncharacterized protein n=1 Tax=Necator americanus TaxID=51031 RepID=A0ABR1BKA4_NECAM